MLKSNADLDPETCKVIALIQLFIAIAEKNYKMALELVTHRADDTFLEFVPVLTDILQLQDTIESSESSEESGIEEEGCFEDESDTEL